MKKQYTKELKERLSNLTREEVFEYAKNGKVTINGMEVLEGWLKISKEFNDKYKSNVNLGVDSSLDMSVMLDLTLDDKLKQMGIAREIVNKVQKLRKSAGLNVEDHIEVFFELPANGEVTIFEQLLTNNIKAIR